MSSNKKITSAAVICILASICCALWGSAFPFVKIGYRLLGISSQSTSSQILFGGLRFTLAGILTILFGSLISKKVLLPSRESIKNILILSLVQTVLQYVFFYIGLSNTSGIKASIIEGMNVFASLLVAGMVYHMEKLTKRKLIGCIIGFVGVILVNVNGDGIDVNFKLTGEGFIILSVIAYAFSSVMLKLYSKKENAISLSGYQFVVGGLCMVLLGFSMGGKVENYSSESIAILIYLACVSAIAYALWAILLKHNPVSKVAVYGFMTPVFGVILSALLLGEQKYLGYKCFLALVLVCAGIYIVNKEK